MRAVVVTGPGTLGPADVPDPVPGPDELLVQVRAAGVNRADLLQAAGRYPPPPGAPAWPGLEVSGTVLAAGERVGPGWRPGDRVAALLVGGGYAERVAVPAGLALRVPDDVDLTDAAALPEALATVWSMLTAARLVAGETLLVRGGSGGIGTVAVQLAAALGARVVATAGGPRRCARVRALGAHAVVDHRRPGFVESVRAAVAALDAETALDAAQEGATGSAPVGATRPAPPVPQNAGVDAVLDVLGAGGLADNLAVLADDGRLAVIGLQQGTRAELDLGLLLARRATVLGATLRGRPLEQRLAIVAAVREHAWPMVADGRVRPVVHARLPLALAGEAHRLMAAGEPFGKLLLLP